MIKDNNDFLISLFLAENEAFLTFCPLTLKVKRRSKKKDRPQEFLTS